jgi:hypothetical protein
MSTVTLTDSTFEVSLTPLEKLGGFSGDVRVPRRAITSVELVGDGLAAVRGLRAPGLALPGRIKLGTWRGRGGATFVAVRRGEPALRLELEGERYASVLVSTPEAEALARRLQG